MSIDNLQLDWLHIVALGVVGALLLALFWRWRFATGAPGGESGHQTGVNMSQQISDLVQRQSELTGQVGALSQQLTDRQRDLGQQINTQLDSMNQRLGRSLSDTSERTQTSLQQLHSRLAVIDRAQGALVQLSGQVSELQSILSNKQVRGLFGQARLEAIIRDNLPPDSFAFQATLSNNCRPDCLVYLPNDMPPLVIDAKFPLESYRSIRDAKDDEQLKAASGKFQRDIGKHVQDIGERYLIKGETHDTAFMFVPAESIYAELNENFPALIDKAHRQGVVIMSPSLIALSIQVLQGVMRDMRIRQQAHLIQAHLGALRKDIDRLDERVTRLQRNFNSATREIDQIVISSGKIKKTGQKFKSLNLERDEASAQYETAEEAPIAKIEGDMGS